MYSPRLGRFASKDPLTGSVPCAHYIYCALNPLRFCDPRGLKKTDEKEFRNAVANSARMLDMARLNKTLEFPPGKGGMSNAGFPGNEWAYQGYTHVYRTAEDGTIGTKNDTGERQDFWYVNEGVTPADAIKAIMAIIQAEPGAGKKLPSIALDCDDVYSLAVIMALYSVTYDEKDKENKEFNAFFEPDTEFVGLANSPLSEREIDAGSSWTKVPARMWLGSPCGNAKFLPNLPMLSWQHPAGRQNPKQGSLGRFVYPGLPIPNHMQHFTVLEENADPEVFAHSSGITRMSAVADMHGKSQERLGPSFGGLNFGAAIEKLNYIQDTLGK
jgi:hypothetical protein